MHGMIYEIYIELLNKDRRLWRTVHVHKATPLEEMHQLIQLLFDWWDHYPYQFCNIHEVGSFPSYHRTLTKANTRVLENHLSLEEVLTKEGERLLYLYGSKDRWQLLLTLRKIVTPFSKRTLYPLCIEAENERFSFPKQSIPMKDVFQKEAPYERDDLVGHLNEKLSHNIVQSTVNDWENAFVEQSETHLFTLIDRYYQLKPWKKITNQQIFAMYDADFDEYLFCTILGKENDLLGFSVYVGFNGLLALHTSLTKPMKMEQLFPLQDNLLLQFHPNEEGDLTSPSVYRNQEVYAQLTSYKPGYFPWKLNDKERCLLSTALEQTLSLFKEVEAGYRMPNYIEDGLFLFVSPGRKVDALTKETVSFESMLQQVIPSEVTVAQGTVETLKALSRRNDLYVQFSLQYIQVPVQRLRNQRPLLPLSSVIINEQTEEVVYHNIYDTYLDYRLVQREFLYMLQLFGAVPANIKTDALTYHYLRPLLLKLQLPVKVSDQLHLTEKVNENVCQFLLAEAE